MRKVYIVTFLLLLFVSTMTCCFRHKSDGRDTAAYHHLTDSFNSLSRAEQVKTCGSCHVREYENEMKGPHANAIMMLHKHLEYVNDKSYSDTNYQNYLRKENTATCVTCHAGDNQYELARKAGIPENADSFLAFEEERSHRRPALRKAKDDKFFTGVDCMSCHYDGNRVVTNVSFKAAEPRKSPPYCDPHGSALFSNSNNCVSCHYDEYKGLVKIAGVKTTDCVKCHQQYDSKGVGTHYTYWRHDDSTHHKPDNMRVMEDLSARYDKATGRVIVQLKNTMMPHPLSLFIEMIAYFEVLDEQGKVWGKSAMRLNRREDYTVNLKSRGYSALQGVSGHSLSLTGEDISDTINIKAPPTAQLHLKIIGGEKGQYWLPDSTLVPSYHKLIKL